MFSLHKEWKHSDQERTKFTSCWVHAIPLRMMRNALYRVRRELSISNDLLGWLAVCKINLHLECFNTVEGHYLKSYLAQISNFE